MSLFAIFEAINKLNKLSEKGARNEAVSPAELSSIFADLKGDDTPTGKMEEAIEVNKQSIADTAEREATKVNTGFFQQLGHTLIGKDTPDEVKGLGGYAGESIADLIRGQAGMSTTGSRGTISPEEKAFRMYSAMQKLNEGGVGGAPTGDLGVGQPGGQPGMGSPTGAMDDFLGNLGQGIPRGEFGLMGKIGTQTVQNKERIREYGKYADKKIEQHFAPEIEQQRREGKSFDAWVNLGQDEQKTLSKKYGEAARVIQGLRNLSGYGKSMDEMDMSTTMRQVWSKIERGIPFLPEDMQNEMTPLVNYIAQQQEVKIADLPILSGQARYVVDLAKAIEKTIPAPGYSAKNRDSLISQSTRNMMSMIYGITNGTLTVGELQRHGLDPDSSPQLVGGRLSGEAQRLLNSVKLTKEQEKAIENAIDYVGETGPLEGGKFKTQGLQKTSGGNTFKIIGEL